MLEYNNATTMNLHHIIDNKLYQLVTELSLFMIFYK